MIYILSKLQGKNVHTKQEKQCSFTNPVV